MKTSGSVPPVHCPTMMCSDRSVEFCFQEIIYFQVNIYDSYPFDTLSISVQATHFISVPLVHCNILRHI